MLSLSLTVYSCYYAAVKDRTTVIDCSARDILSKDESTAKTPLRTGGENL